MRGSICGRVLSPRLLVLDAILVRLVTTGSTVGIPSSHGLADFVWRERLFLSIGSSFDRWGYVTNGLGEGFEVRGTCLRDGNPVRWANDIWRMVDDGRGSDGFCGCWWGADT